MCSSRPASTLHKCSILMIGLQEVLSQINAFYEDVFDVPNYRRMIDYCSFHFLRSDAPKGKQPEGIGPPKVWHPRRQTPFHRVQTGLVTNRVAVRQKQASLTPLVVSTSRTAADRDDDSSSFVTCRSTLHGPKIDAVSPSSADTSPMDSRTLSVSSAAELRVLSLLTNCAALPPESTNSDDGKTFTPLSEDDSGHLQRLDDGCLWVVPAEDGLELALPYQSSSPGSPAVSPTYASQVVAEPGLIAMLDEQESICSSIQEVVMPSNLYEELLSESVDGSLPDHFYR
jgi:hypothetical protein